MAGLGAGLFEEIGWTGSVIIEPEAESDDPGGFPTRPGYMELFRRAGFEVVSAERKPDWLWPVFVLKK